MHNNIKTQIKKMLIHNMQNVVMNEDYISYDLYIFNETQKGFKSEKDVHQDFMRQIGASKVCAGCTKIVLFFDDFPDIVVKIPFRGSARLNILNQEYFRINHIFEGYPHSKICNDYWDHCAIEEKIYNASKDYGLEYMFCATEFLMEYRGIKFYISERATVDVDIYAMPSDEAKEAIFSPNHGGYSSKFTEEEVDMLFYDCYDEEEIYNLVVFLDKYDIGDIHSDNVGFINDQIKIIDYSGYWR